jgi:copper homeostasis protein (lipoprotein)
MRRMIWGPVIAAMILSSCIGIQETPRKGSTDAAGLLGPLPATFSGRLSRVDCDDVDHHLDLLANWTFYARRIYRCGSGDSMDDIGRWSVLSQGKILLLQGSNETPVRLLIQDQNTLRPMEGKEDQVPSGQNGPLVRQDDFAPIEPVLLMQGMYRYMADAALFKECSTGQTMPVAMEGDNRALESAYGNLRQAPGEALSVFLEGRIASRMPMEGPVPVPTLIPEKFLGFRPGETCMDQEQIGHISNIRWKLFFLGTEGVQWAEPGREPHLILNADHSVAGSDGCNRIMGRYRSEGERSIHFLNLASTRMACIQGMDPAQKFGVALGSVSRYRIAGRFLDFLDDEGKMKARFEASALGGTAQ